MGHVREDEPLIATKEFSRSPRMRLFGWSSARRDSACASALHLRPPHRLVLSIVVSCSSASLNHRLPPSRIMVHPGLGGASYVSKLSVSQPQDDTE